MGGSDSSVRNDRDLAADQSDLRCFLDHLCRLVESKLLESVLAVREPTEHPINDARVKHTSFRCSLEFVDTSLVPRSAKRSLDPSALFLNLRRTDPCFAIACVGRLIGYRPRYRFRVAAAGLISARLSRGKEVPFSDGKAERIAEMGEPDSAVGGISIIRGTGVWTWNGSIVVS